MLPQKQSEERPPVPPGEKEEERRRGGNFEDFLAREELEMHQSSEEDEKRWPRCVHGENFDMNFFTGFSELGKECSVESSSSFPDPFNMVPVYRSLDLMSDMVPLESQTGIDKVFEPPILSKPSKLATVPAPLAMNEPVDDLFATLESEFTNTSLPCQFEQLGGIATTSVDIVSCLSSLSATIMAFLKSRGVHFEHCDLSSLWRCELTDFVDSCKFNIQVYSKNEDAEHTVEFLRLSGSSLLFSTEFQKFKCTNCCPKKATENDDITPVVDVSDVSSLTPVEMPLLQKALDSFVGWASTDPAEATRAVCGLFSSKECSESKSKSPLVCLTKCCGDQMSSEAVMVMTLLGTICTKYKQQYEQNITSSSQLPLLSLLNLLVQTKRDADSTNLPLLAVLTTLINSLKPALNSLTSCQEKDSSTSTSSATVCEQSSAVNLLDLLSSC